MRQDLFPQIWCLHLTPYVWITNSACMLFQRITIFRSCVSQLETEAAYPSKQISSIDTVLDHQNGISNNPLRVVMLSAWGSIYLNVNMKTKNETHDDIRYEWQNKAAASISTLLFTKSPGRQESGWWYILFAMSEIISMLFLCGK